MGKKGDGGHVRKFIRGGGQNALGKMITDQGQLGAWGGARSRRPP